MNILLKSFQEITFADVVECCTAGTLESVVLEYKETMPSDLAKHFATFSNTRGGLIIIGVEEDSVTGKSKRYEGIVFDGKLIDQVHQFAGNVIPFPRYEVRPTNEVKGKIFLLIKIFEGDQPPYMTNNDSTVRLRTGNVAKPLRDVDSKELEKLYEKRNDADLWRQKAIDASNLIYKAALDRATEEWRQKSESDPASVSKNRPNQFASPYRVLIMPVSPSASIVDYRLIKSRVDDYRADTRYFGSFPGINIETMPGGIMCAQWSWIDGTFTYGEITEKGVIDSIEDIMNENIEKKTRIIYMSTMICYLLRQLNAAKNFYNLIGFNGLLICKISLDEAMSAVVYRPVAEGWQDNNWHQRQLTKLGSYEWEVANLDTVKLNNIEALANEVLQTIERFYWDFALGTPNMDMLKDFLRQQGWDLSKPEI